MNESTCGNEDLLQFLTSRFLGWRPVINSMIPDPVNYLNCVAPAKQSNMAHNALRKYFTISGHNAMRIIGSTSPGKDQ